MNADPLAEQAVALARATLAASTIPDGEAKPPPCPVCGEPLPSHRVSRWYGRRYDVWSERMAADGLACVTLYLRPYPYKSDDKRVVPPRGRRKGAREGVDFRDPDVGKRGARYLPHRRGPRRRRSRR